MQTVSTPQHGDDDYAQFERRVREKVAGAGKEPLFTTDATGLWEAYLDNLPGNRQHYNCRACRKFIETYGGLVWIHEDGTFSSLLWFTKATLAFFFSSGHAMRRRIAMAKITGVFLSSEQYWGNASTPDRKREGVRWTHLSGDNPNVWRHPTKTAAQAMAEKKEEHHMLCRGLAEYPEPVVREAMRVLHSDSLDRGEKVTGPVMWLLALHEKIADVRARGANLRIKDNTIWAAVATAPPGFCHVKATVAHTLYEDVVAGLPFDAIKRRWAEKMHPLQYQRPQAPPKDGTIKQAEEIVEKLGVAKSLERRYAKYEDVLRWVWRSTLWAEPSVTPGGEGGVFGHLRRDVQKIKTVELPPKTMTWARFRDTVLPHTHTLEVYPPATGSYYGLLTAAHPDAPPILQWDGLEGLPRNPASGYVYVHGSSAVQWGLSPNAWAKVTGVCPSPPHWQQPEKFKHFGEGVLLVIEGAKDSREGCGNALFPENLKAEYHGIRSVVEAHSRTCKIAGREEANANGYWLHSTGDQRWGLRVRVNGVEVYDLDRWE